MTPYELQQLLCVEISKVTKTVPLYDENGDFSKINCFKQLLPRKESDEEQNPFPYCVVKIDTNKVPDAFQKQSVNIILSFGIYYDKADCQYQLTMLSLFEKIKKRFLKNNLLGAFICEPEMTCALDDQDELTYPYYYGAMATKWKIPNYVKEDSYS